jgi:hypothetical protein
MRTAALRLSAGPVPVEQITGSILVLRGHRVLLDSNLANLYDVATKVLLQAVKRNIQRFPEDFMMQLTAAEWAVLRSICDLKDQSRRSTLSPFCLHRAGRSHAFLGPRQ